MDPSQIRAQFRTFVNDEGRYRRFIHACNNKGRLLYWQQRLWEAFVEKHFEFQAVSTVDLLDAFRVCHVHLTPLERVSIPIRKGLWCMTYSEKAAQWLVQHAPYSNTFALDSSAFGDATQILSDRRDECLAARLPRET